MTVPLLENLPDAEMRVSCRVLNGEVFTAAVRRTIRAAVRRRPVLTSVRLHLTP